MNEYQVFVDVSKTWEENEIDLISFSVKEENAEKAEEKANEEIEKGIHDEKIDGREYYVWSISEEDKLN